MQNWENCIVGLCNTLGDNLHMCVVQIKSTHARVCAIVHTVDGLLLDLRDSSASAPSSPEIEELFFLEVADGAAMRALDIISNDLQVWLHVDCRARHQQQVAAELPRVGFLRQPLDAHIAVEHAAAGAGRHDAPDQAFKRHLHDRPVVISLDLTIWANSLETAVAHWHSAADLSKHITCSLRLLWRLLHRTGLFANVVGKSLMLRCHAASNALLSTMHACK